jgi:exodeoxyribonuclease-3
MDEWKPQYVEARESALKIATFNINNINKRLANLIAWLETAEPDVVCLQELKAEQNAAERQFAARPKVRL